MACGYALFELGPDTLANYTNYGSKLRSIFIFSRIRLSRGEGRTELRGRGSEPWSSCHRNTSHLCLYVERMRTNTTKSQLGSPVGPGVTPSGVPSAPAEGHWLYYGYGRDNWLYYG